MATYKVIQDIEAEDKFVGPLTLRQFVFAMFGALFAYLSFFVVSKGITWGLMITLPPMFFGFFMAIPWSSEQPTDVWVLAKIRFRLKPKQRIWDQSGQKELVTITAPKKEDKSPVNNISQTEVKSRLKALADTLDSRGWVIKNAPLQGIAGDEDSDRLIGLSSMAQAVPEVDTSAVPDMMEEKHDLDSLIKESDETRKNQLYEKLDRIRNGEEVEAASQPEELVAPPAENPNTTEDVLSQSLKAKRQAGDLARGNMHTIPSSQSVQPVQDDIADDKKSEDKTEVKKAQAPMKQPVVPDILELAQNNDLNVATIARQANSKRAGEDSQEVVISLH